MDPSLFLQYSPPTGLPQESKLATYMNRSTSTPTRSLNQALGKLSLESSPTSIKKLNNGAPPPVMPQQVLIGEFVPINYYSPTNILPDSPESSPPTPMAPMATMPANPQVHQENVGGTTYFYSTNDSLNTTGCLSSSASLVGAEACMGPVGSAAASPYASQLYCAGTPTHMGHMTPAKPAATIPSIVRARRKLQEKAAQAEREAAARAEREAMAKNTPTE
ncbi:PAN2-PAN3 deadenylation complex subunit PAN3-like [Ostrinia nubilalis]|uniref:PAN2-PAN3 deadenylation complex subunit PAN3-like n=1 Tax=Ostrinia nubilalis TaxID=29057 RepID=UPI00308254A3